MKKVIWNLGVIIKLFINMEIDNFPFCKPEFNIDQIAFVVDKSTIFSANTIMRNFFFPDGDPFNHMVEIISITIANSVLTISMHTVDEYTNSAIQHLEDPDTIIVVSDLNSVTCDAVYNSIKPYKDFTTIYKANSLTNKLEWLCLSYKEILDGYEIRIYDEFHV